MEIWSWKIKLWEPLFYKKKEYSLDKEAIINLKKIYSKIEPFVLGENKKICKKTSRKEKN